MFYKNKVSIIVPAYNVEDYLERCIESILEQSYENLEIIIVNDGSTDYTGIIGKQYSTKFPEKIQYYEINHRGPGAARNAGIQYATGEYIGFVDADDDIHKNMYKEMVATVYKGNIIKNLIMDCQSYTKYRPNETTGGIFVSWRRKEELPTGA